MHRPTLSHTRGDLTSGGITGGMLMFALPMMAGGMLQQLYNIADTVIVGRFIGADALAAVGASYTLIVFITSVISGLCMGSGALFSIYYGAGDYGALRRGVFVSSVLIGGVSLSLNAASLLLIDPVMSLLCVPADVYPLMRDYLWVTFWGIGFTFIYNYYASLLRAVGNSVTPLWFLALSVVLNIALDILFIVSFGWGVTGAAAATVAAQGTAAAGLSIYTARRFPHLMPRRKEMRLTRRVAGEIASYSSLTCLQQSVMNFGILMVQGLVNSFGTTVMAAFAVAVKIDSFAYMPVQDFGGAFSTFIAQNFGAGRVDRIRKGISRAVAVSTMFCAVISATVLLFARDLMVIFVSPDESAIIDTGVRYLRVEGAFYFGIGLLFLLYGYYRAVRMPGFSVVLTVISLGTRVALAYALAAIPSVGVEGIWWSIPAGWLLADAVGVAYYRHIRRKHISAR
ncbi:MAG: MATE family efflux transporter [Rikenellaceae bacterium]|nr:MATE family efflux transporter [Rikenellaceae bacterium]